MYLIYRSYRIIFYGITLYSQKTLHAVPSIHSFHLVYGAAVKVYDVLSSATQLYVT